VFLRLPSFLPSSSFLHLPSFIFLPSSSFLHLPSLVVNAPELTSQVASGDCIDIVNMGKVCVPYQLNIFVLEHPH
jgi:hypothetical protein